MTTSDYIAGLSLLVAVAALLVSAYFARRQGHDAKELNTRVDAVAQEIQGGRRDDAARAAAAATAEAARERELRRQVLIRRLHAEYVASHDSIAPGVFVGNEMPPENWCRTKLREWGLDPAEVYGR